ncbi:MAG TPA: hypothetical protein VJY39_04800 [Acidisphaera sp.]|nr:hypothetical protein [Acidisphaera sp.]
MLQTADDVRRSGLMDAGAHAKITMRHLGEAAATAPEKMTGDEVRAVRERAHLGQKDDD